jgi:hypothetical protein
LTFIIFHFSSIFSATDDGFFSIVPEDYYNLDDYGEESDSSNQLHKENKTSNQNTLQTSSSSSSPTTTTTVKRHPFNIAITSDWGCEEDTEKTVEKYSK